MWSYEVVDQTGPLPGRILNSFGREGWELVSVINPRNGHFIYYFKKPLKEESDE